jgi:hypothetical protein
MKRATIAGRSGSKAADRRPGIASLEFVLVLPFLLALVAGLFILGMGAEHKGHTIVAARHDAWRNRPQAAPGQTLQVWADPMASKVQATIRESYTPPMVLRTTFWAESRNSLVANPWDFHAIPFAPGQGAFTPHLDPLAKIAANIPIPTPLIPLLRTYAALMNLPASPYIEPLRWISQRLNNAVWVAGQWLRWTLLPQLELAKYGAEAALWSVGWWQWWLIDPLNDAIDLFNWAIDTVRNLYEASQGRPGHWNDSLSHHLEEN